MIAAALNTNLETTLQEIIAEDTEPFKNRSISELCSTLRNARHYSKIIIDASLFDDSEKDILSSLYLLKSSNETPVIIIAQGKARGDRFLSDLVGMGIYNFVISVQPRVMADELKECLIGRSLEDVEQYIIQDEQSKNKKSLFNKMIPAKKSKQAIKIAVCGVLPRIGTTTQALRICKVLSSLGKQTCYVECNDSGHIEIVKEVFSQAEADAENKSMVTYNGVTMLYNAMPDISKYEYLVYDYGSSPQVSPSDILVIVAGATAWELSALAERMDRDTDNTFYVFSFTDKQEQPDILDFMSTSWTRTAFAAYCPDMFSAVNDSEKQEYRKLLDLLK